MADSNQKIEHQEEQRLLQEAQSAQERGDYQTAERIMRTYQEVQRGHLQRRLRVINDVERNKRNSHGR